MLCCGCLQAVLSESELVQAAADNATMGRAQQLLQEEKDEVKHMNRIMRYAKCAASREKQIVVGDTGREMGPSAQQHSVVQCMAPAARSKYQRSTLMRLSSL
jgi:hypothetical protein